MLDEHHRVIVAHGGGETALGIVRGGRSDHLEARHVHEERVQALRVLRALAPALADDRAHHERTAFLAAEHVMRLRRHVDELVHGEHDEVHADMDVDRPQAGERHADGRTGHRIFRKRRAKDALASIALDQVPRRAEDRLRIIHVQAEEQHALVARHLLVGRLANRVDEGERPSGRHGDAVPPRPETRWTRQNRKRL